MIVDYHCGSGGRIVLYDKTVLVAAPSYRMRVRAENVGESLFDRVDGHLTIFSLVALLQPWLGILSRWSPVPFLVPSFISMSRGHQSLKEIEEKDKKKER
jgi:hypothetical protein